VTDWQDYTADTRTALAILSRGCCFFPGCHTPILVFLGGRPELNVEIAHVRGADPDGPRFVAGFSGEAESSFGNVLLLCVPHRKIVDRDEKTHPIALLETWRPAGAELREVSEDHLDELLATAFSAVRKQIIEALNRFAEKDPESARLIRQLMDGLSDRDGLDRDVAGILMRVTRQVAALEDEVATLQQTAEKLRRLEEPTEKRANIGWST
jgi:hypothetical protein